MVSKGVLFVAALHAPVISSPSVKVKTPLISRAFLKVTPVAEVFITVKFFNKAPEVGHLS